MKKILPTLFILLSLGLYAQVGIGTTNPDSSSILDVESDDKGILIPRMTALERIGITSPAEGLMVYQTDDVKGFYFYDGTSWDRMLKESKDPVPTGAIFSFPLETPPTGYLVCDGSAVSRTTYADLFAVLGTSYGAGDGTTTFNLPDYRGKFLRGYDNGAGNDPDAAARQDRGDGTTGDAVGTLQDGEMESHLHQVDPPLIYSDYAGNHQHNTASQSITSYSAGNHSHTLSGSGSSYTGLNGNHNHTLRGRVLSLNLSNTWLGTDYFLIEPTGGADTYNTANDGDHTHTTSLPSSTNSSGSHTHNINIPGSNTYPSGSHYHNVDIPNFSSDSTGGSTENRPLNITVVYCIKF